MYKRKIISYIMAGIMLFSHNIYVMAEDKMTTDNTEYGYIFTVKSPEIKLMSIDNSDNINVISENTGIYHADNIDDIKRISKDVEIDKIARDI